MYNVQLHKKKFAWFFSICLCTYSVMIIIIALKWALRKSRGKKSLLTATNIFFIFKKIEQNPTLVQMRIYIYITSSDLHCIAHINCLISPEAQKRALLKRSHKNLLLYAIFNWLLDIWITNHSPSRCPNTSVLCSSSSFCICIQLRQKKIWTTNTHTHTGSTTKCVHIINDCSSIVIHDSHTA